MNSRSFNDKLTDLDGELQKINEKLIYVKNEIVKHSALRNIAADRDKVALKKLEEENSRTLEITKDKESIEKEITDLNVNCKSVNEEIDANKKCMDFLNKWCTKLENVESSEKLMEKYCKLHDALTKVDNQSLEQNKKCEILQQEIVQHRGINDERENFLNDINKYENILAKLRHERVQLDEQLNEIYDKMKRESNLFVQKTSSVTSMTEDV